MVNFSESMPLKSRSAVNLFGPLGQQEQLQRDLFLPYEDIFISIISSDLQICLAVRNNVYFSSSFPLGFNPAPWGLSVASA